MIEKMTKYGWIVPGRERDNFLDALRRFGVIDITRSTKPVDATSEDMLERIESLKQEISFIERGSDPTLLQMQESARSLREEAGRLKHWGDFDPARLSGTGIPIRFYCLPEKSFREEWAEEYALQIIDREDGKLWFVVLDAYDFPAKECEAPSRPWTEADAEARKAEAEADTYAQALASRRDNIPSMNAEIERLTADLSAYLASLQAESAAEDSLCVFEGFAPAASDAELKAAFDDMDVCWTSQEAEVSDNPPIKLKNNSFVRMFEILTDMYGRPAYDGFDPTPYISIFFLLFFAMCIGDAGYGLVLIAVGLLLRGTRGFGNLAPLVVTLGAGTTVVGILFHTFFSVDISGWEFIPGWLKAAMVPAKIAGYDGTMILALAVGVVHLLLAMIVKTVYATRGRGFLESLSTWGWTVFWTGLAAVGICALAGVIDAAVTKWAVIVIGIVCAIGIFPLNNIHRNPLINIGSGLWDTYNMATGILGDVLSYLRLYALGLAGAMLGFAFNDLALMALGNGGVRWIAFILIVIVGHTLNVAMAALGAFVHPLRLNFLEFFKNSDYQGVGLKYNPLKK